MVNTAMASEKVLAPFFFLVKKAAVCREGGKHEIFIFERA